MRQNLPKEMDFVHEAKNAERAEADFKGIRTSLYIPKVITATKRVLIMEYIQGGRVDDLAYLAEHNIDRNKVALELSRIFNQMVFINGWFHAGMTSLYLCRLSHSDDYRYRSSPWQPSYSFRSSTIKIAVQFRNCTPGSWSLFRPRYQIKDKLQQALAISHL